MPMNRLKARYENGECPVCGTEIPDDVREGDQCQECDKVFVILRRDDPEPEEEEYLKEYEETLDNDDKA